MVPPLIFDISNIDLNHTEFDAAGIEKVNPHRGLMRLLDGIIHVSPEKDEAVAYKNVHADEFWVPGHIPGRPILPGVLIIEASAQMASFVFLQRMPGTKFLGFAGVDDVKFRGQVVPGDRLILLGKLVEFRPRRIICKSQALVNGTTVFEGTIIGMPM